MVVADRVVSAELGETPAERRAWNWETAVLLYAVSRVARDAPSGAAYLRYVADFYESHEREGIGAVTTPDLAVLALPAADLELEHGIVVGRRTVARARAFYATEPRNPLGVLDHVGRRHRFRPWLPRTRRFTRPAIWVDSLFMAVLTEARLAQIDGDSERADRAAANALVYAEVLQSPSGLFKHACFYERDELVPHGSAFWLRGHAWALVTFAELIELAPEGSARRAQLVEVFVRASAGVLAEPRTEGGLWPTLLRYDGRRNPVEVSGSLLAAAALAQGYRLGLLDRAALVAARQAFAAAVAWHGVTRGDTLRLGGMSSATNAARRPLSYTNPLRRERENAGYGLAGLLLVAGELTRSPR